jgi:nucleotide-binding universal stress UspA family protein
MDPWTVLTGLFIVTLVFIVVPVGTAAYTYWRQPRRLTCPRTGAEAQIEVAPAAAAAAAIAGGRVGLEHCSLWPVLDCHEECLALPATALRSVPRGEPPPRPPRAPGAFTILVPLDGCAGSERVLEAVGDLARSRNATVRLLRVVRSPESVCSNYDGRVLAFADQENARVEDELRTYMKQLASSLSGVPVETAVRFGDPVAQIVEEAESAGADLIAMASHRRGALGGHLRHSVARRLGWETTLPLLLVPYDAPAAA